MNTKLRRQILLANCLLLTAFCLPALGQGGTGKLPVRKLPPPIRNPPVRGQQDPIQIPQGNFAFTINKQLLGSGIVAGDVSWRGPAPTRKLVDVSADPECVRLNPRLFIEAPIVRRGRLANAFVYVKDGTTADGRKLNDISFPLPNRQVVVDQKGCVFIPHVLGIMVGETITVTNSDATAHNVHFMPKRNTAQNQSHASGGPPITHSFTRPEIMVPLRCNQHPWMKTYVGVLTHPFFAVTGEDGKFEIRDLPPGKYTLAVWHESGNGTEITRTITVAAPR